MLTLIKDRKIPGTALESGMIQMTRELANIDVTQVLRAKRQLKERRELQAKLAEPVDKVESSGEEEVVDWGGEEKTPILAPAADPTAPSPMPKKALGT